MAMLSNITISLILIFILILSGYLISAFFDLEIAYYMPYILWLLGLVIFNLFLDKQHINIYKKKTNEPGEEMVRTQPITTGQGAPDQVAPEEY
jgi:hypothetical protein